MNKRLLTVLAQALATTALAHGHTETPTAAIPYALDLIHRRQPEQAAAFLETILEEFPLDVQINLLYLDIILEEGLQDLARPFYEETARTRGGEPIILVALGRLADRDRRNFFQQALEKSPDFVPALAALAWDALARGDYKGAEEAITTALRAAPRDGDALACRGVLRLRRGDLAGAREDLTRALAAKPYAPSVHAALGDVHFDLGDFRAAQAEYRAALAQSPRRGLYYLKLARAQERAGEETAARLNYLAAAERAGGDTAVAARAYKSAALLAVKRGDDAYGAELLEKARALGGTDAETAITLSEIYLKNDNAAGALSVLCEVATDAPPSAKVYYLMGIANRRLGDYAAAEEALARAAELAAADATVPIDAITREMEEVRRAAAGK